MRKFPDNSIDVIVTVSIVIDLRFSVIEPSKGFESVLDLPLLPVLEDLN